MKYILGVAAVVIALIVAIFVIATRPSETPGAGQDGKPVVTLKEEANGNSTLIYTIEGKIVGEEERRAVRISVNRNVRTFEVLEGYTEKVIRKETYSNNSEAFDVFVAGLEVAGFSRKRESKIEERHGACPFGRRYTYELTKNNDKPVNTWSTSCSAKEGTFGGAQSTVQQLFQNQIPNYNQLTSEIVL